MSRLPQLLLVDTNVWLDFYLPNRPGHAAADKAIVAAYDSDATLMIASTSLKDFFYIAERTLKAEARNAGAEVDTAAAVTINRIVWSYIKAIMEFAAPVSIGLSDMWLAQKQEDAHGDLEDDLLIGAALRTDADFIISNDVQLMHDSEVPVISPQHLLNILGQ